MAIALSQIRVEAALDASQYVAGAKAKTDADAQMVQGAEKLTTAIDATERRLGTSGVAYERLARSIDPAYQAQQRLAAGTATLQRALDGGAISSDRHAQLLTLLQQRYGQTAAQAEAAGAAIGRAGGGLENAAQATGSLTQSLSLNRQGFQELQASGINAFQALSSGMSVWRVAQTEGAQVLGAFVQGGTLSFRTIAGWGGIIGGVTVALGILASRYISTQANLREFRIELETTARGSTATADNLSAVSERLHDIGISASDVATNMKAALAQAGPSLGPQIVNNLEFVQRAAQNTAAVFGTTLADGQKTFIDALKGGVPTLTEFATRIGALTIAEAAARDQAAKTGDAHAIFDEVLARVTEKLSGKYQESLSSWGRAMLALSNGWNLLIDELSKQGVFDDISARLKHLDEQLPDIIKHLRATGQEWTKLWTDFTKPIEEFLNSVDEASKQSGQATNDALQVYWKFIKGVSDSLDPFRQSVREAVTTVATDIVNAFTPLSDSMRSVFQSIIDKIKEAIDAVRNFNATPPSASAPLPPPAPTQSLPGGGASAPLPQQQSYQGQLNPADVRLAASIALPLIEEYESSGRNVLNDQYDPMHTAGGYYQITNKTWRGWAPQVGFDLAQYPTAISAPRSVQAQVATYGYNAEGFGPWTNSNPRLASAVSQAANVPNLYPVPSKDDLNSVAEYIKRLTEITDASKLTNAQAELLRQHFENERLSQKAYTEQGDREKFVRLADAEAMRAQSAAAGTAVDMTNREAEGASRIAKAYETSTAAGLRQTAVEQARLQTLQSGGDAERIAAANLELHANQALQAAEQQRHGIDIQVAANENLARASASGTAELIKAQVANQAAAQTYNALAAAQAAYDQAQVNGTQAQKDSTASTLARAKALDAEKIAQLTRNEAATETTAVNVRTQQLKDDNELIQAQIPLQGKTSEEIQAQVELLRLKQDLDGKYLQADPQRRAALLAETEARGQIVIKLGEARAAQQRLDEEVRSIADTVANTLGTAIDSVLSGKKITDWGTLFKDMLRTIANTVIQSELIKPLIGSVLQSVNLTQTAQQFGTIGSGGGIFSSLLGIGQAAGSANSIASATGLTSGTGGPFSGIISGINSFGSSAFGLANPALQGPTLTGATLGESGILGGVSLTGLAGIGGIIGLAIPLITSLFGNKKPSNNAGGLNLDLSSGGISGASGNQANLGVAQQIGSSLATFEQQLLAKIPGATLPGGAVNIQKGDVTGITTDYSGPLGHIKASFGSAQDAINAFSVAIAKDLGGIGDTLKQTLSRVTDPSQIQAAIDVANAYDKVKDSAGGAAKELSGAYDDLFKNITTDSIRSIGPFENVLNQINDRFNQLTQSASQYGLSLDPINVGYKAAKDRLADDFNTTIAQALQALKDPAQAAVDAEKKAGDQRVVDAKAVGADLAAVEQYNEANLKKYTDVVTKNLDDAAKSYANFTASIVTSFASITSNFGQQAGPFEKALASVNDNFKNLAQQAIAAGNATDDITHNAIVSRGLITRSFNASIADLMQTITDPVQEAIDVEARAGQARVREAIAVNGDLDAVNRYNAVNLQKVATAAATASNTLQQVLSNASSTLSAALSNVTVAVKGPFEDALDALYKTFGDLTTAAKAANASGGDLASLFAQLGHSLESLRQSFNTNIQALSLALTNPFQAALDAELAAGRKRVTDAIAVGGDLAAVDEYNRRSLLAVAQAAADATKAITTAASYNTDIAQQILAITDPMQAAFNAELAAGRERVAAAQRVGADLAQVDELNRLKLLQVADSFINSSSAIQASTDALAKFTGRLQNLQAALGQLTSGPLSGLTPAQQVKASTSSFDTLLARVKGGNLDLIPDLTQAGTAAVAAAQAAYGNAKQTADLRERITSALFDVSTQTGREAIIAAESTTITAANQAQVKRELDAQAASLRAIADAAAAHAEFARSQAESALSAAGAEGSAAGSAAAHAGAARALADSASGAAGAEASIAATIAAQANAAAVRAAEQASLLAQQSSKLSKIAAHLTTQVQTQEQIATADSVRAGLAGALLKHDAEIATRTAGVANNIGTIEQQTAYLAAVSKQAAEAAARVVVAVPDTIAYHTAASSVAASALAAVPPAPSAAVAPNALHLPSLEVSAANLWAQYNKLSANLQSDYNAVVGTNPGDYNPPDKLVNKIYLVALLSEYQSLSPTLQNAYDSIVSANRGFYNNTLWGILNKWDFITTTLAPLAASGYASGTTSTEAGWIRVGERGPELIHQGGGNIVLPNGVLPVANDNSGLAELRALREEVAALRRQIQGGQAQASRDANAIVGETANIGRAIAMTPVTRRVVA